MFTELRINGELWWGVISMNDNLWIAYKDSDPNKTLCVVQEAVE